MASPVPPPPLRGAATGGRVLQCAELEKTPQFGSKAEVLVFLQSDASLAEKSRRKSEWNKTNPRAAITTSEWDFNAEKKKLAALKPPTTTTTPSASLPVTTTSPPSSLLSLPTTEVRPVPHKESNKEEEEEMEKEDPEEGYVYGKAKKKKKKEAKEYKVGSVYDGKLGPIALDHLPHSHPQAQKRAEKLHHGRRATKRTIFTEEGYALAVSILKNDRRELRVARSKPGGDVILFHPTSKLYLGVHVSQPDAKVYPTEDNSSKYIEKD